MKLKTSNDKLQAIIEYLEGGNWLFVLPIIDDQLSNRYYTKGGAEYIDSLFKAYGL